MNITPIAWIGIQLIPSSRRDPQLRYDLFQYSSVATWRLGNYDVSWSLIGAAPAYPDLTAEEVGQLMGGN